MSSIERRRKAVDDWLFRSTRDLRAAKDLYDDGLFDLGLYHLQQSNEKLAKSVLLYLGFMTPKTAREDFRVKKLLGFQPKEPIAYGHRTTRFFISDLEKSLPSIESLLKVIRDSEFGPRVEVFMQRFRRSKKSLKKLKQQVFKLIESPEQLETEVKTGQAILSALEQSMATAKDEADGLNDTELLRIANSIARDFGYEEETVEPNLSIEEIKAQVLKRVRLFVLGTLSISYCSFLDPLEAVTRYPDRPHQPFDENNAYTKNFMGIHDVLASIIRKVDFTNMY